MKVSLVLVSFAFLAPLLSSQAYKSSPPSYIAKEGENSSARLGGYPSMRVQIADGNYRSRGLSMKEVAVRVDYWNYDGDSDGAGRRWGNVTISVADTDIGNFSTTFTKNHLSTPTQVFSAAVVWPTLSGLPKGRPAPIGGAGLTFPFKKSYSYSGSKDLLLEYTFDKGTLLNKAAWNSNSWKFYSLDADNFGNSAGGRSEFFGSDKCMDSGQTKAGLCSMLTTVKSTGTMDLFLISQNTAGGKAVLKAVGLNGFPKGINAGTCQLLYANPMFLFPATAFSNGFHSTFKFGVTYTNNFAGVPLWAQAAYDDSKTKAFSLTKASLTRVPSRPVTSGRTNISSYAVGLIAKTSALSPSSQFSEVPLQFFR